MGSLLRYARTAEAKPHPGSETPTDPACTPSCESGHVQATEGNYKQKVNGIKPFPRFIRRLGRELADMVDFVVPLEGFEPPTPSLRMLYFVIFYRQK